MKEDIFDESRHRRVQGDGTNVTTNGRKQTVGMVLQKLHLNKLLSYLGIGQNVFTEEVNGASSLINLQYNNQNKIINLPPVLMDKLSNSQNSKLQEWTQTSQEPLQNNSEIIHIYHNYR